MAVYDWIIGLGLTLGIPLLLMLYSKAGIKSYFVFATMINAFCVYAGLLESWTLISLIIVDIIIVFLDRSNKGGDE